jgi:uncharacterized protein (TIGR02300 family)
VAKPEWGNKQQCPKCGARFYDLNREPVTCVKCGEAFEPESVLKSRRPSAPEVAKPTAPVVPPVETNVDVDVDVDVDPAIKDILVETEDVVDADDDLIADSVLTDDDDEDLAEVLTPGAEIPVET